MTEDRFVLFNKAMDSIVKLEDSSMTELAVYNDYLASRATALSLSFDDKNAESRAIVRLACLCRISDPFAAIELKNEFKQMSATEREALTAYLDADGLKEKPGFILCDSPEFLENAWRNKAVGLLPAMRS